MQDWLSSDSYYQYRPVLYQALGKLAKEGYPIQPADSGEYIQDFYIEGWPGVVRRYDPSHTSKATFGTYLYGAFVRFARPRIVQENKWRACLISSSDILENDDRVSFFEENIDYKNIVYNVFERMPEDKRNVLAAFVSCEFKERPTAKILGMNRHEFRRNAVNALATFSVELESPEVVPKKLQELARLHWVEEKTIEDTARKVGLEVRQAQRAKIEIMKSMQVAFERLLSNKKIGHSDECIAFSLLLNKIKSGAHGLREEFESLLPHIEECERCQRTSEFSAEDLNTLYSTLGNCGSVEINQALLAQFEELNAKNENEAMRAVEEAVFPALSLEKVTELLKTIKGRPSLQVFLGSEAISRRIHRHARHEKLSEFALESQGLFAKEFSGQRKLVAPKSDLVFEIASETKLHEKESEFLFRWLLDTASSFRKLFLGTEVYMADPKSKSVSLVVQRRESFPSSLRPWTQKTNSSTSSPIDRCANFRLFLSKIKNNDSQLLRAEFEEFLLHIEECEKCQKESEFSSDNLEKLYSALGDDSTMEVNQTIFTQYEQLNNSNENEVMRAVEEAVFPALSPKQVTRLSQTIKKRPSLHVFLGSEAISRRIHRHARHEKQFGFELAKDGLFAKQPSGLRELVAKRSDLIFEISADTKLSEQDAAFLFDWLLESAASFRKIFLGMEVGEVEPKSGNIFINLQKRDFLPALLSPWMHQSPSKS
jgi:hypothetical protein